MTSPTAALSRDRAVLLVIDIQERLTAAMPAAQATKMIANTRILIEAAGRLGVPIVISQQYPKGLGPTVGAIEDALGAVSGTPVHRFDKLEFSAVAAPAFGQLPLSPGPGGGNPAGGTERWRDQWIVCGEETHVCVYQTVRDLVGHGPQVHVVADAVASRTKANWRTGMDLAARVGAVPTSTEVVVFDLLGKAGTDEFKSLSKIIK